MLAERAPHLLNSVEESLSFLNGRSVGIDIDAVTQATYILALRKVSKTFGKVISKDHLKTYWELVNIVQKNGISADEALGYAKGAWNNEEVFGNAPEMPGIRSLMMVFNEIGVPYVFMSSRPVKFEAVTRRWFKDEFPWVPSENIILGRKDGESGGKFKSEAIQKHNVGLHIEDVMDEALEIAKTAHIPVLVVPQPWNVHEDANHQLIRTLGNYSDWDGAWPVLRFLVSKQAKTFFGNVAQCH